MAHSTNLKSQWWVEVEVEDGGGGGSYISGCMRWFCLPTSSTTSGVAGWSIYQSSTEADIV